MLCPAYCVPFARWPFPKCRNAPRAAHRCRCWYTGAYDGIRTRGGASKPVHSRRSTAGGDFSGADDVAHQAAVGDVQGFHTGQPFGGRLAGGLRQPAHEGVDKRIFFRALPPAQSQHCRGCAPALRHCHGLLRAGEGVGMADEALDPEQMLFKIGNNPRKLVGFQTRPHHIELLAADENRGHRCGRVSPLAPPRLPAR